MSLKKRRLLCDPNDPMTAKPIAPTVSRFGDPDENTLPVPLKSLSNCKYRSSCFACNYVNKTNLAQPSDNSPNLLLQMMQLYTQNAQSICKEVIYNMVKEFYDTKIKHSIEGTPEWTIECIEEHFTRHSCYPTDEILHQLDTLQRLRKELQDSLVRIDLKSRKRFDLDNITMLMKINNEIIRTYQRKKEVPQMYGYDQILDY